MVKTREVLAVVLVLVVVSEAAVFGAGNIMARRYPNGPREFHGMKVPVYRPQPAPFRPATRVSRPQPDSSWMFQRGSTHQIYRNSY